MGKIALTKTKFCAGLQCLKRLYWTVHERDAPELVPDVRTKHLFAQGHEVGEAARWYFSGGVLIGAKPWEKEQAVEETRSAMQAGAPAIFEAAFEHEGLHVRVDVLEKVSSGAWKVVEVKSSTRVKPEHIPDMAVQLHVLERSGVRVEGAELMHLNRECRCPDLDNLFVRADCTTGARKFLPRVEPAAGEMIAALSSGEAPRLDHGPHCYDPRECPFTGRCVPERPEHHVEELYNARGPMKARLAAAGVAFISDIPDDVPLSGPQLRQLRAVRTGRAMVTEGLAKSLAVPTFPIYYLDFETCMPAIPRYPGTGPYWHTPVQFSCHAVSRDGQVEHSEYLGESEDPRGELAERLLDALGGSGTIVTYSSYEERRVRDLARVVPARGEELLDLVGRMWDLCRVIQEGIYHPDFRGSFSLKAVYPALCPGRGFDDLEVTAGDEAMALYTELMRPGVPEERRGEIREALLRYCARDTQAMLDIHWALETYI